MILLICDVGDAFNIPSNIEKTFEQISKAVGHVFASGAMPAVLGGSLSASPRYAASAAGRSRANVLGTVAAHSKMGTHRSMIRGLGD